MLCLILPLLASPPAPPFAPASPQETARPLPAPDLADAFPATTFLYVDAPGLTDLAREGLDHPLIEAFLDAAVGERLLEQSPVTPEGALFLASAWLGQPFLPTLHSLTAQGVALGFVEPGDPPGALLHARGEDPEVWRKTLEALLERIARDEGFDPRAMRRPHANLKGYDLWFLGDDLSVALSGASFFASNRELVLRNAIKRLSRAGTDGEASQESSLPERLQTAWGPHSEEGETLPLLRSYLDLERLEALDPDASADLRELARAPAMHFLFGSSLAAFGESHATSAWLELDSAGLSLELDALGLPESTLRGLLPPILERGLAPPPGPATESLRALVHRDLSGLFETRTELFPVEVLPKFGEALGGLALFFGGEDVADSVLPELSPWMSLVVREPEFSAGRVPDQPLPAAALLATVEDSERLGPLLVSAFQTAIGITNVEAAQQMRPPLAQSLELVGEVPMTSARYPAPRPGAGIDVRYNLEPACALVGSTFVLGTHRSLVAELALQLQADAPVEADRPGERLTALGPVLASVVRANASTLAMDSVLKEGRPLEDALAEIETLALGLEWIERIELDVLRPEDDRVRARLALELER